jgi:hypothetical protein
MANGKYSDSGLMDDNAADLINVTNPLTGKVVPRMTRSAYNAAKEAAAAGKAYKGKVQTEAPKKKSRFKRFQEKVGEGIEKVRRAVDYDEEDRTKAKERWK